MGDCVPTPTATQFATTEVDTTTLTTTLLGESTVVYVILRHLAHLDHS